MGKDYTAELRARESKRRVLTSPLSTSPSVPFPSVIPSALNAPIHRRRHSDSLRFVPPTLPPVLSNSLLVAQTSHDLPLFAPTQSEFAPMQSEPLWEIIVVDDWYASTLEEEEMKLSDNLF